MLSDFFIARPTFAWVIGIGIMLAGGVSVTQLPIAQYPDVAPPAIAINTTFPGANASTLESSVTELLEQQLTGLDGLLYFASSSNANGTVTITATFKKGVDPDIAEVQVQNRLSQATSRLPPQVQLIGVTVTKSNTDYLLIVGVYDQGNHTDSIDVGDWISSNLQDEVSRVPGVGQTQLFGSAYAMRIWLDPYRLAERELMPSDVATAVAAQNVDVSAGQLGEQPLVRNQQLNAIVNLKSRLHSPEQFRNIVLKSEPDGSIVHLSDVARVEMGADTYGLTSDFNGHPAAGLAVELSPGADALETARAVKARVASLTTSMPADYRVVFPRDSTDFIKRSVREVVLTLFEAIAFVVIVMFVFLQNWRAALIPAITIPIVLLGTFGILAALGYTINTLVLFGMVLAIGLLVDDAIVVVENVERIVAEERLPPPEATRRSMAEISSALVGVGVVLAAVLLPMAFLGGSTGVIYRQFSLTVVSAISLSVFVALIFTPALCATILVPATPHRSGGTGVAARINGFLDRSTRRYVRGVTSVLERRGLHVTVYLGLTVLMVVLVLHLPRGFLPTEDQGEAIVVYTLPAGATAGRTSAVRRDVENFYLGHEAGNVAGIFGVNGFSFSGYGQNVGMGFAQLASFDSRRGWQDSAASINGRAIAAFSRFRDARVFALTPPPIPGLDQSNGFTFELLNTSNMPRDRFALLKDRIMAAAGRDRSIEQVRINSLADTSQFRVTLDEEKLAILGLAESDVTSTLSAAFGSTYINDFDDRGRVKRVYMQADAPFRMKPEDVDHWFIRGPTPAGGTVPSEAPISAFSVDTWEKGPSALTRFDGHPSFEIQGNAAFGVSSGQAMDRMVQIAEEVAPGTGYAWSGLSYQEEVSRGRGPILYGLSTIVVFLCLAALYESWSIPFAVLLVMPLGIIGTVIAVTLRSLQNDIYFQVGLLTTMGLSAKNAILITEFAEMGVRGGRRAVDAAIEAARLRLRPILMTSIAFIVGVMPLATATGAGAASRVAIGTAVLGGMLTATFIAVFYIPLFFVLVSSVFRGGGRASAQPENSDGSR